MKAAGRDGGAEGLSASAEIWTEVVSSFTSGVIVILVSCQHRLSAINCLRKRCKSGGGPRMLGVRENAL